jgi:hypothetical protein
VPWAKGQSGNPRGSPTKERALAPALRALLREREPTTGETYRRCVALALVQSAMAGNVEAIKTIFDRVDGPLKLPVEHTGAGGGPLAFDYGVAVAALVAPALSGRAEPDPSNAPGLAPGPNGHRLPSGQAEGLRDGPPLRQDVDGG